MNASHGFGDAQTPFPAGPAGSSQAAWPEPLAPYELAIPADTLIATIGDVLVQVRAGKSVLVTEQGKVIARIDPEPLPPANRFGLMAGKFTVPDDFDETPEDLIDIMEGRNEGG